MIKKIAVFVERVEGSILTRCGGAKRGRCRGFCRAWYWYRFPRSLSKAERVVLHVSSLAVDFTREKDFLGRQGIARSPCLV